MDCFTAHELTKPVYVVGATVFMICAYYSDKIQVRSYFIIFGMSLNLIGASVHHIISNQFTILLFVPDDHRSPYYQPVEPY